MKHLKSSIAFWEAIAILMGGTIGAGIPAIPYGASRTGLVTAIIILVFVGIITLTKKLMMAEIALRTAKTHQLPGYIGHYLGHFWKIVSTFVFLFAAICTILAYLIGEGVVLAALFGGSPFYWSLGFFSVGAAVVFLGLSVIKRFEVLLTIGMLGAVLLIGFFSFDVISLDHFVHMMPTEWVTPYTILLFAFSGVATIPQMRQEMNGHEDKLKSAVITGSLIIGLVYLFFMVVVLGVTGLGTTEIATIGLGQKIGPMMLLLGNSLAALTMGTSFLTLSLAVQEMFAYDSHSVHLLGCEEKKYPSSRV